MAGSSGEFGSGSQQLFDRGAGPMVSLLFFVFLSLVSIIADHRYHQGLWLRSSVEFILTPIERIAAAPWNLWLAVARPYEKSTTIEQDNQRLRLELLQQTDVIRKYSIIEKQLHDLRALLGESVSQAPIKKIMIVQSSVPGPFHQTIRLLGGENEKVRLGATVMTTDGLVGQVTAVNINTSEVTLVTDKTFSVSIQVQRTGARALTEGSGASGGFYLSYFQKTNDLRIGDQVVTSGLDGVYPSGIFVGTVRTIKVDPQAAFMTVWCAPSAYFANHADVLVVMNPLPTDFPLSEHEPK